MSNKRVDAIEQLFLSFNREVGKNRSLVENYLTNLIGIETKMLENAVNHLIMNSDRLPRWTEVKSYCDNLRSMKKHESVPCDECWGIGMVYSVFFDDTLVRSDAFVPETDSYYYEAITGRCACENGERYMKTMPVSRYTELVKQEFATGQYIAPAQACSEIVIRKNRQLRELVAENSN